MLNNLSKVQLILQNIIFLLHSLIDYDSYRGSLNSAIMYLLKTS